MYIFPDMIDLGLKGDQEWPEDEAYCNVAQTVGLCNSLVTTRGSLTEVVQAVLSVPKSEVRRVTVFDLATIYKVPYIRLS